MCLSLLINDKHNFVLALDKEVICETKEIVLKLMRFSQAHFDVNTPFPGTNSICGELTVS